MAETASAKVCIHCGQDCSKKARTKDPQGRYACKECHEAALAKTARGPAFPSRPIEVRRPAPQTEPGDEGTLSALLSQVKMSVCPACSAPLESGAVFCTRCGVNPQTGQRVGTRIEKAVKEPKAKARRGPSPLMNPMWSGLGALAVLGTLFALAMSSREMMPVFAIVAVLYMLVFGLWMLVDAFRQSVVSGLLYIFLPFYGLYYGLAKCENAFLKTHWGIGILGSLIIRVLPWSDLAG